MPIPIETANPAITFPLPWESEGVQTKFPYAVCIDNPVQLIEHVWDETRQLAKLVRALAFLAPCKLGGYLAGTWICVTGLGEWGFYADRWCLCVSHPFGRNCRLRKATMQNRFPPPPALVAGRPSKRHFHPLIAWKL